MARVFTIDFPFKGKMESALVSFGSEAYDMSFVVRYLDEDINQIIPGGRIVVSLSQGVKSPKQLTRIAEDLVYHTTAAISEHLHFEENK
jgi:hypothetical protein